MSWGWIIGSVFLFFLPLYVLSVCYSYRRGYDNGYDQGGIDVIMTWRKEMYERNSKEFGYTEHEEGEDRNILPVTGLRGLDHLGCPESHSS
jgi:hypothetical protein